MGASPPPCPRVAAHCALQAPLRRIVYTGASWGLALMFDVEGWVYRPHHVPQRELPHCISFSQSRVSGCGRSGTGARGERPSPVRSLERKARCCRGIPLVDTGHVGALHREVGMPALQCRTLGGRGAAPSRNPAGLPFGCVLAEPAGWRCSRHTRVGPPLVASACMLLVTVAAGVHSVCRVVLGRGCTCECASLRWAGFRGDWGLQ